MTRDIYKYNDKLYFEVKLKSKTHSYFISSKINIFPIDLKNDINKFIVPRKILDKYLTFFLDVIDGKTISSHSMPNVIAS